MIRHALLAKVLEIPGEYAAASAPTLPYAFMPSPYRQGLARTDKGS